ncbi:hypothetical protein [Ferrovibrio sp.]|uniref:hypothetical protein n=1 Tax=Ferrovibrio sp. TaxID=1917215 RepID=UPI0035B3D1DE
MLKIDPGSAASAALASQFKAAPFGPYSADLQKMLQLLRWGYARGRTIIVCTEPYKEWRLGRMGPKRGMKVELDPSAVFTDYSAAVWACFRARFQEVTGQPCPIQ